MGNILETRVCDECGEMFSEGELIPTDEFWQTIVCCDCESKIGYEKTLENIGHESPISLDYDKEKQVFDWLWLNNQSSLEPQSSYGSAGHPSSGLVKTALIDLGLLQI